MVTLAALACLGASGVSGTGLPSHDLEVRCRLNHVIEEHADGNLDNKYPICLDETTGKSYILQEDSKTVHLEANAEVTLQLRKENKKLHGSYVHQVTGILDSPRQPASSRRLQSWPDNGPVELNILMYRTVYDDVPIDSVASEEEIWRSIWGSAGVDQYFQKSTFGMLRVANTSRVLTVRMEQNYTDHCDYVASGIRAREQATIQYPNITVGDWDLHQYHIPDFIPIDSPYNCGFMAVAYVGCAYPSLLPIEIGQCDSWYRKIGASGWIQAHEMGHNLGMLHSAAQSEGSWGEYYDSTGSMGTIRKDSTMGTNVFNANTRQHLGLLSDNVSGEVLVWNTESDAVTLQTLTKAPGSVEGADYTATKLTCPDCKPHRDYYMNWVGRGGDVWMQYRDYHDLVYVHHEREHIIRGTANGGTELWAQLTQGESFQASSSGSTSIDAWFHFCYSHGDSAVVTIASSEAAAKSKCPSVCAAYACPEGQILKSLTSTNVSEANCCRMSSNNDTEFLENTFFYGVKRTFEFVDIDGVNRSLSMVNGRMRWHDPAVPRYGDNGGCVLDHRTEILTCGTTYMILTTEVYEELQTVVITADRSQFCEDVPNWVNTRNQGCAELLNNRRCGSISVFKFEQDGYTADSACCGCGGGLDKWLQGEAGSKECPAGAVPVDTEEKCELFSLMAGFQFEASSEPDSKLTTCYVAGDGSGHFDVQPNATRLLCERLETAVQTTTSTTQEPDNCWEVDDSRPRVVTQEWCQSNCLAADGMLHHACNESTPTDFRQCRACAPSGPPSCMNLDVDLFDSRGLSCVDYDETYCGIFEASDFNSSSICCTCGGGNRPTSWATLTEAKVGVYVIRGRDWDWLEQDQGQGSRGVVIEDAGDGWVKVEWADNGDGWYRIGDGGKYDLLYAVTAPTTVLLPAEEPEQWEVDTSLVRQVTDEWCQLNCRGAGGELHPACNPSTHVVHRQCRIHTAEIQYWRLSNGGPVAAPSCANAWRLNEVNFYSADGTSLPVKLEQASSSSTPHPAHFAVDGDNSTMWAGETVADNLGTNCYNSTKVGFQWIELAVEVDTPVMQVDIHQYLQTWSLSWVCYEISSDRQNWSTPVCETVDFGLATLYSQVRTSDTGPSSGPSDGPFGDGVEEEVKLTSFQQFVWTDFGVTWVKGFAGVWVLLGSPAVGSVLTDVQIDQFLVWGIPLADLISYGDVEAEWVTVPVPCTGDRTTWNAGYGGCEEYSLTNAPYCNVDLSDGLLAAEACSECGCLV